MTYLEKVKGFMFSPSESFNRVMPDTLKDAFKYYIVFLIIYAILQSITLSAFLTTKSLHTSIFGPLMQLIGNDHEAILAIMMFITIMVFGIIGIFITGIWLHFCVYMAGGRMGIEQTIKALMYGITPYFILGWIPVIGIIAGIWSIVVEIIGVQQLHDLSTGKAVVAYILAIFILIIVYDAIIAMFVFSIGPPAPHKY
ncbi:MAG: YIP1 family protein [Methanosarcinales archaeon]